MGRQKRHLAVALVVLDQALPTRAKLNPCEYTALCEEDRVRVALKTQLNVARRDTG